MQSFSKEILKRQFIGKQTLMQIFPKTQMQDSALVSLMIMISTSGRSASQGQKTQYTK